MANNEIREYSLLELKKKFEHRDFAVPEMQRQYVWNKRRICHLMDSIYRNYPVGISLIWHTPNSKALQIRPTHNTIIPPFNIRGRHAELIIDGQQRLSTLYGVLNGVEPKPKAEFKSNFKELFFDCNAGATKRFVFSKRFTENSKGFVRLTDLLNSRTTTFRKKFGLNKGQAAKAKKCHSAFFGYKFYMLSFRRSKFKDVKEVFIRINSAGMTVSRADTLFANATKVNLRHHMLEARRGLRHGFADIKVDAMQNTLALVYGAKRIGAEGIAVFLKRINNEKKNSQTFHKEWKKIVYGYEEAVDFAASDLKITSLKLLPSQNIFTMLSYFFYLNGSRPNGTQAKEIAKWFWHTSCGERYSGAKFNRNIPKDIQFMKQLAKNKNTKYSIDDKIDPLAYLKTSYKSSSSSITTSYFLMLRHRKPLYLSNASEMLLDNQTNEKNRKDRHHIFPFALLNSKSINRTWINSIANICYLESDENKSFSKNHPMIYLEPFKRKKHFGKVMKSHLIPYKKQSPIWTSDVKNAFRDFLNCRGLMVVSEISKLAKSRMFTRLDEIKRI